MKVLQNVVLVAAMSLPTAAVAKEVTITLTDQEQAVLVQLMDMAVKAGGLNVDQNARYFVNKLRQPPTDPTKPEEAAKPGDPVKPEDTTKK